MNLNRPGSILIGARILYLNVNMLKALNVWFCYLHISPEEANLHFMSYFLNFCVCVCFLASEYSCGNFDVRGL